MYFLQFFQIYLVLPSTFCIVWKSDISGNVKSTKICPLSMLVESQQFMATFDIDQERRRHSAWNSGYGQLLLHCQVCSVHFCSCSCVPLSHHTVLFFWKSSDLTFNKSLDCQCSKHDIGAYRFTAKCAAFIFVSAAASHLEVLLLTFNKSLNYQFPMHALVY